MRWNCHHSTSSIASEDIVTDPEVRAELQEEMNCVGMSWQFRQMFDEEEESPPQTKPQANATALQS